MLSEFQSDRYSRYFWFLRLRKTSAITLSIASSIRGTEMPMPIFAPVESPGSAG
jgi:hypothetical protein